MRDLPPAARRYFVVFRDACKLGLEGIVSKRLGSRYRSGRSPDRRRSVRRKSIGVADYQPGTWSQRLQGRLTETLRVTLASFRKVDNLLGDRVTSRLTIPSVR
ncbi:MAG: hypothetical protein ACXU85_14665 [Xanthobacteraceae bacterium]